MGKGDVDDVSSDAGWDAERRDETEMERLDRNWGDLLQELRVTQTGVQFLTGFLLTLPFQQRFTSLSTTPRMVYLVTVVTACLSTISLVAPVSLHRILFRRHQRADEVSFGHRFALAGLAGLGLSLCGTADVIFSMVEGVPAGWAAAAVAFTLMVSAWLVLPLAVRRSRAARAQ